MKETVEDLESKIVQLQAERNVEISALRKRQDALKFAELSKLVGACWKVKEYTDDDNYYSYRKLVSCDNSGSYLQLKIFFFEEHKSYVEDRPGAITFGWSTESDIRYYSPHTKISTKEFEAAYKRHLKKIEGWKEVK
jgi:hypothetical protein